MLVPSPGMRGFLESRLQSYSEQFWQSEEAMSYWASRGLTKQSALDFKIGFVGESLKGDSRFRGRLAIPYLTADGGVVGFKFRVIDNSPERFSKDRGEPNRIFNTRVLRRARKVVVCEGEGDTIAAAQAGLQAVGIPGANNWKPEWSRVFFNREVTVLADGDEPGHDFAELVASKIYGVRIVDMPDGEDVASMVQRKGEKYIFDLVTCS